ncbi:hypothetical protein CLM85_23225 [Streptomyces albidoflavus]|uniref:hypothetical protein n=1 Tax=Streptomyces albidoflavus TaxID=1886 RepID=UPI000BADEE26|nr:hypothetical protein [Streptomyces albidoflavus]PAX87280.1 hypothetical protein CLM81_06805 [Streptomyces albidoflavus]PAX89681.1 hypothetical protein CLM82_19840 [Streptomyces albidoflavus]PBO16808.1 hypothetical protein CLM83_21740 [Streptomyces albidoflavus]PBO22223.1 hypothetical protein CLM85_23225 [Streptomyces albidoflavus]PBO31765.1 hypothetical protein CLM84_00645 [Streptomyces albidoflavus]
MARKAYPRRARVTGTLMLLVALGAAGCTGDPAAEDSPDAKPAGGQATTAQAEPGKYQTLPQPCRAVETGTLDAMLPGLAELDQEQRQKAYEGTSSVTYDSDRRTGCRWKVDSADAGHLLRIDFERVVSYSASVSDDARAQAVYGDRMKEADLPLPSDPREEQPERRADDSAKADRDEARATAPADEAGQGASPETSEKPGKGKEEEKRTGKSEEPADETADPSAPAEGLEPRLLQQLADDAFIDDQLTTSSSGSGQRTVTVVFRTSNVIVTVEYEAQPKQVAEVPDSASMQEKARELAGLLAERLSDV